MACRNAISAGSAMLATILSTGLVNSTFAQCDPDTGPPSSMTWYGIPWVDDDPWKYCTSAGFFYGTACFPLGAAIVCGSTTFQIGQSFEISGGFEAGGFSISASSTYEMSQSFTCDATNNKKCRIWVCFANTYIRHVSCLRYIFWGSFDNSYTIFIPGDATVFCCCRPAQCMQESNGGDDDGVPPIEPSGRDEGGVSGSGIEKRNSVIVDLANFFTPLGVPPPGHPLLLPSSSLDELTKWHLMQIQVTAEHAAHNENVPLQEIVVRDLDGTQHFFPLDTDPFPFWGAELTQNSSTYVQPGVGVACFDSGAGVTLGNAVARSYNLATIPGIAGAPYVLNGVVVGIDENTGSDLVATVNVYVDTDAGAPIAPGVDLALLATKGVVIPDDLDGGPLTVAFDAPVTVPADSTIVVELTYPPHADGGVWPGCNTAPQSGPTYFMAPGCGVPTYVDLASLGFPDVHFVQTLVGSTPMYLCESGGPANDCATSATVLGADDSEAFSNVGATTDGPAWDCPYGADVWYLVQLPAEGVLTVDVDAPTIDATVMCYDLGSSSGFDPNDLPFLQMYDCVDRFGPGGESVSLPRRPAGTFFLIQVAGWDGGAGASTGAGTITTSFERTLFDTRGNDSVMYDPDTTAPPGPALSALGWSSGHLSAAQPQRWAAQAFTVPDPGPNLRWRATQIHALGFTPAGALNTTLNWVMFRRTAMNAPTAADQFATGSVPFSAPIENLEGASALEDHRIDVDLVLDPGNYWLTVYAANASGDATPANFGWFTNAPQGLNNLAAGAPFMWRSSAFPAPGFVAYTLPPTASMTQQAGLDPADLYNTAFRISGAIESTLPPCPADLTGDGVVDGADLATLLGAWGTTGGSADVNDDGSVDGADLAVLLGDWGPCPAQ